MADTTNLKEKLLAQKLLLEESIKQIDKGLSLVDNYPELAELLGERTQQRLLNKFLGKKPRKGSTKVEDIKSNETEITINGQT